MNIDELAELPEGWIITSLGQLGEWSSGGTPSRSHSEYYGGDIPWVKTGNLPDGLITEIDENITVEGLKNSSAKLFPSGSLIVAMYGATIGKLGILKESAATNQACGVLISKDTTTKIIPYLFYFLLRIREDLRKIGQGGAQPNISQTILKDYSCPLPPLNEQRRIVAKIEALSARSQRVKEALHDIPQLLDQFRQSVLAAAFRGDLTADWRSQNSNVEPASNLLSLIDTPSPEHHLDVFEKSSDYKLPSSWVWIQLGKLGSLVGGGTPSKSNSEFWNGSIPWVSPKDMKQDRINDSIDHISEEAVNNSSAKKIPKGSILFVVRGMILNHTLPVAITDTVVTINQDMKALVPELNEMSEYLLIASKFASNKMLFWVKAATHGTRRLESPILKDWAIPIPPLREQKEIVNRVKSFFKAADTIQQQYQETKAHLDQLDQSMLAKAFRGELVPQDPNDEPASVLLERIREERAKIQTKTAKKSTTATSARRTKKTQPQEESVQLELGLE